MSGYCIVGDIGGTNARFALARNGRLEHYEVFETDAYPTLEKALDHYLRVNPKKNEISTALFAVAAPVIDDTVVLTNSAWSFSRVGLETKLGFPVSLVNDFAAVARAIPHLSPDDYEQVPRSSYQLSPPENEVTTIIGPGTGLGVATLVRTEAGWTVLPGEGGHVTMAAATPEEDRVIALLRDRWEHVSAERLLSGDGLVTLYEACCELRHILPTRRTAAAITAAATGTTDDPHTWLCAYALDLFCAMLGTVAGNLALTLGSLGGVYIAGGILPRFPQFFAASRFRYRFEQKGRLSRYLARIPTFLVTNDAPGLIGLANWGPTVTAAAPLAPPARVP